jgi:hypothetical protein
VQVKVLLLSQRRIADLVAYCLAYKFEDTFATVTGAGRIDLIVLPGLEFFRRAYKLARLVSGSLASRFAPYPRSKLVLERDFELFFPVFSHTYELYSLATSPNWRQRCRLLHQRSLVGSICRNICSSSYQPLTTSFLDTATASRTWRASRSTVHLPAARG